METVKLQRKLAAIMFTDIYQYSRLMSLNEEKAMAMLVEHNRILDGIIGVFHGSILKRMGDAIFAQFDSSVDALKCAIQIQNDLKKYNTDRNVDDKIIVRIGIHVGDVIVHGEDLFGEGVNVAARLEPLADPGGICISQSLYESAKNHATFDAIKVGDVELKNILERYTIYKIPSSYEIKRTVPENQQAKNAQKYRFKVRKIASLPVKNMSAIEITVLSMLIAGLCIVALSVWITESLDVKTIVSFLLDNMVSVAGLLVLLGLVTVYFYSTLSIRVVFDDVRNIDQLLEFLVAQMGYKPPVKDDDHIVFMPSAYHFIMYSARPIRTQIDGNSVVISGNYMFVRKLIRIIKSFEAP
ncbi:MAG: hypothetical protein A2283_09955 [Lentisphaerae bacterium RIFOXYA12_FULL_48_11]|nr:MAG: hypothetical protein A2283_09955 [Lentisphaerae bacterium RIFOXYA12_FULL_48_11]